MGDVGDRGESSRRPIDVTVFGRTDVGLVREHNEDNFLVADLETGNRSLLPEVRNHSVGERGTLLAVCDGMGGAAAGEVASQIAVDTVYELMQGDAPPEDVESLAKRLEDAVLDAGKRIFESARADRSRRGMGTTITAAAMISEKVIFAQVGDSRAYLIRNGKMVQVTRDQSLVNQLIEAGQLKPEEAELFEHSNIILQALGTAEDVTVDLTFVDLRRGDVIVMCSDGLSGLVSDDQICEIVLQSSKPIDACKTLTEAAREAGGHDNITVIVAQFEGEGLTKPKEREEVEFQRFDLPGREGFHPRQPQKMKPDGTFPSSIGDEDDDTIADQELQHDIRAGREHHDPRGGARSLGTSPWFMGAAVIVVLAVGVGLGYLIVSGTMSDGDAEPPPALDEATEVVIEPISCRFTADAPGTRLVIDGHDYGEIPPEGRWIALDPGLHSVEGRYGADVVVQHRLELTEDQERVEVPLLVAATLALNAPEDGGALPTTSDGSIDEDGDVKPPDTGLQEVDTQVPSAPNAPTRDVPPLEPIPAQPDQQQPGNVPLTKLPPDQRNPPRKSRRYPDDISSPNPY